MKTFLRLASFVTAFSLACSAYADPSCPSDCETPAPTRMRSVPLFITGVFFDTIGAAGTAAGIGLLAARSSCPESGTRVGCSVSGTLVDLAGIGALAGGAVFLAIGIPLTVVGAKSVPAKHATSAPVLYMTGAGAKVEWAF